MGKTVKNCSSLSLVSCDSYGLIIESQQSAANPTQWLITTYNINNYNIVSMFTLKEFSV